MLDDRFGPAVGRGLWQHRVYPVVQDDVGVETFVEVGSIE